MKKNSTIPAAKKARKIFKKELAEKITIQLTAAIGETTADSKKTTKAIAKAAKNLAKKIAKNTSKNKPVTETEQAKPVVDNIQPTQPKPVKTKTTSAKKATANAEPSV